MVRLLHKVWSRDLIMGVSRYQQGRQQTSRLCAACALLVVLLGSFAKPVSLAAYEPDVCAMECCVEAGHCCCATRHAFVEGHLPDDESEIVQARFGLTCPAQCTPPSSFSLIAVRTTTRTQPHEVEQDGSTELSYSEAVHALTSHFYKPSTPRAPPTLLPLA